MLKPKITTAKAYLGALAALLVPTSAVFSFSYIDLGMVRGDADYVSRSVSADIGRSQAVYAHDGSRPLESGSGRALTLVGSMVGLGALAWLIAPKEGARGRKEVE